MYINAPVFSIRKQWNITAVIIFKNNPEYFFEMAPYALALGVDRNFARRFGKTPLPESSCFVGEQAREMTAVAYAARLRRVADVLNRRQKQLPYEKLKR